MYEERKKAKKAIEGIPGLKVIIDERCKDLDPFSVDIREISPDLMVKTSMSYSDLEDTGFDKEFIVALSSNGKVVGELDKIPAKDNDTRLGFAWVKNLVNPLAFVQNFFVDGLGKPEAVIELILRLNQSEVENISTIIKISPEGKIFVHKLPSKYKSLLEWFNDNRTEIEKKVHDFRESHRS